MFKKIILSFALFLLNLEAFSAELTVTDATVTKVQVYETSNDTTNVWIHLNGNSRVGPNPENSTYTCELWTYNSSVHATALSAMMSGKKVSVVYRDRGEGTYWCKVYNFSITNQ